MPKQPKIVIVGAGPMGCYLGQLLKHYGFDPLLLEEHSEVGRPIACAGIVGSDVFKRSQLPLSRKSIMNKIDGAKLSFHNSAFLVKRSEVAYIIDRAIFDQELSQGLNVELNCRFKEFEKNGPGYILKTNNGEYYADIVVGADGPHSKVRTLFEFETNLKIYKGLQYRIKKEIPDRDRVEVSYIKPFSLFNWIIPEGNGTIRVGTMADNPYEELNKFLKYKRIEGDIVERNAGPIPIGTTQIVKGNVVLLGDAACQIKPITSGGIFYGMRAAEMLARAIKDGDLVKYDAEWKEEFGQEIKLCLMLRNITENIDEKVLVRLFDYIKENSTLLEKVGDFENHSSVLWSLMSNPQTYSTMGSLLMGIVKRPSILKRIVKRR